MVEIKIEWSNEAEIDLFEIMEFYSERNGNPIYSQKIYHNILYNLEIILKHPLIGKKNSSDNTRKFIVGNFEINYLYDSNKIIVAMIWDSLMDPKNKRVGK